MKRVIVRRSGGTNDGKVIGLCDSIEELLSAAGKALCVQADNLRTSRGDVIDDTSLIRDDEILYVSTKQSSHEGCSDMCTPANVRPLTNGNINTAGNENPDWITLNVGGKMFTTTRYTLVSKVPDSMLGRMFATNADQGSQWSNTKDNTGAYLIDRSPTYFEPVLDYLRHGNLVLGKGVSPAEEPATDHTPITRREFIFSLLSTPAKSELRCQGMNFSSADFSKLDLRNINFKYSNLRYANLSGANLSYCNFERADLSHVNMEGATLLNVKLVCVHLEGAVMTNCNFEDPAGSRTNMEGANMKNVNLEGSHMAGVNLRVATLKNSNLQNCDLRGAVLAGADLENCDLSGCDLQEANLRGANLKGASLELMLNPLHMSQTVTKT